MPEITNYKRKFKETLILNNYYFNKKQLSEQYYNLYFSRLSALSFPLKQAAHKKWGDEIPIRKLSEFKINEKCAIIGVIYKKMAKKKRPLDMFCGDKKDENEYEGNLTALDDVLYLEEFHGRVELRGLKEENWTTGFFVALLGQQGEDSKFHVEDYCLAGLGIQKETLVLKELEEPKETSYIAFISGLRFGGTELTYSSLSALSSFLTGSLGGEELRKISSQISRLVIAGDSFSEIFEETKIDTLFDDEDEDIESSRFESINNLDLILSRMSASLPIDLMSGKTDPSNFLIPQKPIHKCIFPKSSLFDSFRLVSNPFSFEVDGITFFGTSGQNIEDICKHSKLSQIEALEKSLLNRLIFPTCPDTLPSAPFSKTDSLILDISPHVYFSAGERFESKKIEEEGKEVLLLIVPKFCQSSSLVLVDKITLHAQEIKFETMNDSFCVQK